jgi:hypothetical protein
MTAAKIRIPPSLSVAAEGVRGSVGDVGWADRIADETRKLMKR